MRIWILTSEYPPFPGGISHYVDNYSRHLGKLGHQVTVFVPYEKSERIQVMPNVDVVGFKVLVEHPDFVKKDWEPDRMKGYPFNILPYWAALSFQMAEVVLKTLETESAPDIIESQDYAGLAYYLLQRKLTGTKVLEKIPVQITLHGPLFSLMRANQAPRYRLPDYWIGEMEKFCLLAADTIVSPSQFLIREVEQELRQSIPAEVIPAPSLTRTFQLSKPVDGRDVLFVGRLQYLKGVIPLITSCVKLWLHGENFRLIMVGGDTFFEPRGVWMNQFIQQRFSRWIKNGNLVLTGIEPHEQVLKRMVEARVIVLPSLWENFPTVCLEAMSHGKVMLASESGGQAEIIGQDGENGFLFSWKVPGDFEKKLRIALSLTPEEQSRIGQNAQLRVNSFCDPDDIIARRLQNYEETIRHFSTRTRFPVLYENQRTAKLLERRTKNAPDESSGLLSVVIPYFNLGKYLPETLESINLASYKNREVIIVDDGSTDDYSLQILKQIEERHDSKITIFHNENQGLAATRNFGASAAKGEYLVFVDADDQVEPEYFEKAIEILQRYENVSFVYSWLRYFDASKGMWPTWNAHLPYMLCHNMATALSVIRRSDFLAAGKNKPEIEYAMEDFEGWLSVLEAGGVGVSLTEPASRYRVRPDSMWRSTNINQILYLHELISENHPDLYREWGVEVFNLINQNGPSYLWDNPGSNPSFSLYWAATQKAGDANKPRITQRDYELGGRIIYRLRQTWLARVLVKWSPLKEFLRTIAKKLFGFSNAPTK